MNRSSSMAPTPNSLPSGWCHELQPLLDALEADRQKVWKSVSAWGAITAGITAAATLAALFMARDTSPQLAIIPIIIGIIVFASVYTNAASSYRNSFKTWVLPKIVTACAHEANGTLEYSAGSGIPEVEFRGSGLFKAPDRYSSEDLVTGKVGETALRFSEVHAEDRRTRTDARGRTQTEYVTIFRGLFFVADFNKSFHGTTLVLPDTAEQIFGRFGQNLQKLGAALSFGERELVKLEDPEFERQFVVYSTDQVEARYILSPALMQRLLKFRSSCKAGMYLSFSLGSMVIAVPLGDKWLEPPGLSTPLTLDSLGDCFDQLRFALGIVEELDLNTRIWSK